MADVPPETGPPTGREERLPRGAQRGIFLAPSSRMFEEDSEPEAGLAQGRSPSAENAQSHGPPDPARAANSRNLSTRFSTEGCVANR